MTPVQPVELFIEVRCEEIPARFVAPAMEGFATSLQKLLGSLLVGDVRVFSTPRRLAVAAMVMPARPAVQKVITGMPLAQAKSADGEWTPAALGFAKKRGGDASALFEHNGFAAIRSVEGGESAQAIVAAGLEALVLGIPFKKTMRWGTGQARFARPLHDVACVLGGEQVYASVAGITTCAHSVGHWLLSPESFPIPSVDGWLDHLRELGIYADRAERHLRVEAQLNAAADAAGLHIQPDADLLNEVVDLVESPRVVLGHFPSDLLKLPPRLLIESMKVNQKYFPLFGSDGLSNAFLVVTNNPEGDPELIAEGNGRVLAARFHDAKFFYAEDRKRPLAKYAEKLGGTVWIRGLGTVAERQAEITTAAVRLSGTTGADPGNLRKLGGVLKADLATLMVGEFPELQGHVGHLLAAAEGYENAVAIEEAWLPRHSGDHLPATPEGLTFALAERMTLLSRCFTAEMEPKGSADPQGLRRAAVGLVALVLALPGDAGSLGELYAEAGVPLPVTLTEFVVARLRAVLLAEGHPPDLVEAVMAAGDQPATGAGPSVRGSDIRAVAARVRGLAALPKEELAAVRTTFRRVAGLGRDHASSAYALDLLQGHSEYHLHVAVKSLPGAGAPAAEMLEALRNLRPVVDRFFAPPEEGGVMVMCDDLPLRANRLGLLRSILDRFAGFADFTRLGGE